MPPRKRKSPERPASSRSLESSRPHGNSVKERCSAVGLPSVVSNTTRHVTFAPTPPSVRTYADLGDSRISLKTLLNAIKTMEGRLEGKIEILASRPLLSKESSHFFKRDLVSDKYKVNLREIQICTRMKKVVNNSQG